MFGQGLESFFLSKDESVVAVCTVKYLEVGIIHPGGQALVTIIPVLGKGLETGIEFRYYVGMVELVDEVEWRDVFFVVFKGIVDGRGRG